jgi:hypothetical protein
MSHIAMGSTSTTGTPGTPQPLAVLPPLTGIVVPYYFTDANNTTHFLIIDGAYISIMAQIANLHGNVYGRFTPGHFGSNPVAKQEFDFTLEDIEKAEEFINERQQLPPKV